MLDEEEITPEELARIQEEEFGVSPEERARINAKLSAILTDIRAGQLPLNRLPDAIHDFGEEHFGIFPRDAQRGCSKLAA